MRINIASTNLKDFKENSLTDRLAVNATINNSKITTNIHGVY